ncbi:MAG: outer membrane beta-barrel protein [Gammaproteobacteria bacterium]|nr:outer membrane beta-barrel protein [Gammaproteobacteria bacterium]
MKKTLIASLILTAFAGAAQAASPNYDKIEFGYNHLSVDDEGFDVDFEGYVLNGSVSVSDHFFLQGGIESLGDDESNADADIRSYNAGVGFRAAIIDNVDFNATLDYLNTRWDGSDVDDDSEDGLALGLGLRAMVTDNLELAGMVKRVKYDGGGSADDFALASATYNVTTNFGIFASMERCLETSDADRWTLGARFSF